MGGFEELTAIVARLRGEGGCPWDRAQTLASMRPYLLEEAYEVLAAIDRGDGPELERELGDLVFTAALVARIAEEEGLLDIEGAVAQVNRKMIERHPHVFDPAYRPTGSEGDVRAWEARKARERRGRGSALDGVPDALPALLRAHRISEKAGAVGFDWPDAAGVRAKLDEELAELDVAIAGGRAEEIGDELGDVLFTLVNLGRHLPVAAEDALRVATDKFSDRFRALEASLAEEGRTVHDVAPAELEERWQRVKGRRAALLPE